MGGDPPPFFTANYANAFLSVERTATAGLYNLTMRPNCLLDSRYGIQVSPIWLAGEGPSPFNTSYSVAAPNLLTVLLDIAGTTSFLSPGFTVCIYKGNWQNLIPDPALPPLP